MEGKEYFKYLLIKYMQGTASDVELDELYGELEQDQDTADWEALIREITMAAEADPAYVPANWEPQVTSILSRNGFVAPQHKLRRLKVWLAAACVALLLSLGSYFLFLNKSPNQEQLVAVPAQDVVAPETNRAMITLADGRTVYLDSAANGELVQQGNIKLVKFDNGQIAYQIASGEVIKEMQYNTLSNPRGSKVIDMALSDGSHVWLNAGSSVTYPVAFVGNERKVNITGEAYFEITHDARKPFTVSKKDVAVTVLGTHFNVNAYDDETSIKVTLLEGSVRVTQQAESKLLKPGDQVSIGNGPMIVNKDVDTRQIMSWKEGRFIFDNNDLPFIMRELSRWYNVEVSFEGSPTQRQFSGVINRSRNISEVIDMLKQTEVINFRIEGNKITVTP